MHDGPTSSGADDEHVVVSSGDVTSIGDPGSDAEPVASGGSSIAASLTSDPDVLNIAFLTGGGDVQFVQLHVADLIPGGASASAGDVVVTAELTALSADVIGSGGGAATPVGAIAVAANLDAQGDLSLSFVDGNGHLQLIETNVAELLQGRPVDEGGTSFPSGPGSTAPDR